MTPNEKIIKFEEFCKMHLDRCFTKEEREHALDYLAGIALVARSLFRDESK